MGILLSRATHVDLQVISGPGVAIGLVNPFERASRTVLRGASRGFEALLVARAARLRRGVGDAASPLTSEKKSFFL